MLKIVKSLKEKTGFLKESVVIFLNHYYFSLLILLGNINRNLHGVPVPSILFW